MEIKVGDKVRVSKDAPRHIIGSASEIECKAVVLGTDADIAVIGFRTQERQRYDAYEIPTKYLIKVEDEAKFKKGDKVRYIGDATEYKGEVFVIDGVVFFNDYFNQWQASSIKADVKEGWGICNVPLSDLEPYTEPTAPKYKKGDRVKFKNIYELQKVKAASFHWMLTMFASKEATITAVEDNGSYRVDIDPSIGGINDDMIESKVEPTAPTIKVGDVVRCKTPLRLKNSADDDFIGIVTDNENGWFRVRMNNGAIFQSYNAADLELVQPTEQTEAEKKPNIGSIKIPVEVDLTDSYWGAYAADLARDIAVKIVNKNMGSDPEKVGEYAVKVAKSVVEELKRK